MTSLTLVADLLGDGDPSVANTFERLTQDLCRHLLGTTEGAVRDARGYHELLAKKVKRNKLITASDLLRTLRNQAQHSPDEVADSDSFREIMGRTILEFWPIFAANGVLATETQALLTVCDQIISKGGKPPGIREEREVSCSAEGCRTRAPVSAVLQTDDGPRPLWLYLTLPKWADSKKITPLIHGETEDEPTIERVLGRAVCWHCRTSRDRLRARDARAVCDLLRELGRPLDAGFPEGVPLIFDPMEPLPTPGRAPLRDAEILTSHTSSSSGHAASPVDRSRGREYPLPAQGADMRKPSRASPLPAPGTERGRVRAIPLPAANPAPRRMNPLPAARSGRETWLPRPRGSRTLADQHGEKRARDLLAERLRASSLFSMLQPARARMTSDPLAAMAALNDCLYLALKVWVPDVSDHFSYARRFEVFRANPPFEAEDYTWLLMQWNRELRNGYDHREPPKVDISSNLTHAVFLQTGRYLRTLGASLSDEVTAPINVPWDQMWWSV